MDEKLYKNVLVYNISNKTLISAKPLCRTRYLVLFGAEKYDLIYNRIIYLIRVKCGIACVTSQNYAKIKIDSYDSLPLKKTLAFYNVIILNKSVFSKDKNNYYNNIFLGKVSY